MRIVLVVLLIIRKSAEF